MSYFTLTGGPKKRIAIDREKFQPGCHVLNVTITTESDTNQPMSESFELPFQVDESKGHFLQ